MTAKLHHTLRAPVTATGTTAAADYPATNVLSPRIRRPWRSTSIAADQNLILDLGASVAITAVALHDVNFASCEVLADNAATPTTSRGTLTTYAGKNGRRRGSLAFSATVRYIRFRIPLGTPTDGAAYFNVGYAPPFQATLTLPRDPSYGADVDSVEPQSPFDLVNDQGQPLRRGPDHDEVRLPFVATPAQDVEEARRRARAALCWLDVGDATQAWLQWPVRAFAARQVRRLERFNRDTLSIAFSEQV